MPRPRQRVSLQQGLCLNLNQLRRQGFWRPGLLIGPRRIRWSNTYTGETIASGSITADLQGDWEGWLHLQLGGLDQYITMVSRPRHFGGRQWYFKCPITYRRASVFWLPPGAHRFCSRQTWRRQVAYASQFETPTDRAWRGQSKIKARLIADRDPDEWAFPPKPKWMRWATYNRYEAKFDNYESVLDMGTFRLMARFLG